MSNVYKLSLLLLFLVPLSGCDGLSEISNEDLVYEVGDSDAQDIEVLLHRLRRYPVSFFSSIDFDEEQNTLTFKRGAPDKKIIQFMAEHTGQLAIYGEADPALRLSNQYVARASVAERDNRIFIQLQLSDEGGKLLNSITKSHIGKAVIVELDGALIMKPIVRDALGKYFEMTFEGSASDALMTSALIEFGSLRKPIRLKRKN